MRFYDHPDEPAARERIHRDESEKATGYNFDVVDPTRRAKAESLAPDYMRLPDDGVVIGKYDAGGWYLLFGAGSPRAGQVALFEHEVQGEEAETWNSLEAFFASFDE